MLNIIGSKDILSYIDVPNTRLFTVDATARDCRKRHLEIISYFKQYPYEVWGMCFGELDCREDIFHESIMKGVDTHKLIEKSVKSYLDFVQLLDCVYTLYVFPCPPQGVYSTTCSSKFIATREIRHTLFARFNGELRRECIDRKIPFLDLWEEVGGSHKDLLPTNRFIGPYLKPEFASKVLEKHLKSTIIG